MNRTVIGGSVCSVHGLRMYWTRSKSTLKTRPQYRDAEQYEIPKIVLIIIMTFKMRKGPCSCTLD